MILNKKPFEKCQISGFFAIKIHKSFRYGLILKIVAKNLKVWLSLFMICNSQVKNNDEINRLCLKTSDDFDRKLLYERKYQTIQVGNKLTENTHFDELQLVYNLHINQREEIINYSCLSSLIPLRHNLSISKCAEIMVFPKICISTISRLKNFKVSHKFHFMTSHGYDQGVYPLVMRIMVKKVQ